MPNIIFNIPFYFTGISTYMYTEFVPKLKAMVSVSQSVERWSRDPATLVQFPASWRRCSSIFRNWSLFGLKMYIFLTLEFTLL